MRVNAKHGLAAIGLLALASCASTHPPLSAGDRYVAMGSSFAAGGGIGPTKAGTPERCGRTALNYPSLLAAALNLDLADATCGGARTEHVLGPWSELPPQLDALTPETRLVTITIGGNDLGYVASLMLGGACGANAAARPANCAQRQAPDAAAYARVEQSLRDIAAQVHQRAPHAQLVFVQYLTLVPDQPCDAGRLWPEDAAFSREIGVRLAEITRRVASETGAMLLPADEMSRTHTPCDAAPWTNGWVVSDAAPGSPWHPNRDGMRVIADALARELSSSRAR